MAHWRSYELGQPPSGGCVLKRVYEKGKQLGDSPAAFGRLCVETRFVRVYEKGRQPAAFGRLCVETRFVRVYEKGRQPAAFGRLCVETSFP